MPKCNSEKYSTDEYCGLISSNYSPWSLCLQVYTRHDFKTRTIFKFYILQKLPKAIKALQAANELEYTFATQALLVQYQQEQN